MPVLQARAGRDQDGPGPGRDDRSAGKLQPLLRLHAHLGIHRPGRCGRTIAVLVESGGQSRCVLVDHLLGKQEVVIKSLGETFCRNSHVAGAAILRDGHVALILDPQRWCVWIAPRWRPPREIMRTAAAERAACRYLSHLIQDRCGIQMQQGKEGLIKARLGKRMRQHGLTSLPDYCDFLREQEDEEELARVVDALTIHFTNFLREKEHFQFMVEEALPALRQRQEQRFHAWSAASSSGEEAYSIGIYLAERSAATPGWDWRVSASDVSGRMLEKARLGVYTEERVRTLPRQWVRKYFQKGVGPGRGITASNASSPSASPSGRSTSLRTTVIPMSSI